MKKSLLALIICTCLAVALSAPSPTFAQSLQLTVSTDEGSSAHILPTEQNAVDLRAQNAARTPAATGALSYHGGLVITKANTYAIFWIPATGKLQNGNATTMTAHYQTVLTNFLKDYPGHGIGNNNTQYYQGSTTKTYIQNAGTFGGSYVDTASYPASGCTDSATPGNCVSDAQLQSEIARVMSLNGWTGGNNNVFFIFTSSGEGSCVNSGSCAFVQYCAYHSHFSNGGLNVIYGNEPFGTTNGCAGNPSPNSDPPADSAATSLSHELTESITDPFGNAWFDSTTGAEIGDLCNQYMGYLGYDLGKANEFWNGHYYAVQTEYDNYLSNTHEVINGLSGPSGCFNVGPEL